MRSLCHVNRTGEFPLDADSPAIQNTIQHPYPERFPRRSRPTRCRQTIYEGCGQLKNFPNMGRPSRRMEGRRELSFPPLPYIAVYHVKEHAIEISRIFHGAQDWP